MAPTIAFPYNPHCALATSTSTPDEGTNSGRHSVFSASSTENYSMETVMGPFVPNVVCRQKRSSLSSRPQATNVSYILNHLMIESVTTMRQYLSENPEKLNALVHALIVDHATLRLATSAHGGLIISTVLKLIPNDLRTKVLLEVVVSDTSLVWDLATQTTALQNIYDTANNEWRHRLHDVLISRLPELCYHPQGNFMVSHALRSHSMHHDNKLLEAVTDLCSDGAQLLSMCQNKAAVFVAVGWASAVTEPLGRASLLKLLRHPKSSCLFSRLARNGIAYKIVVSLLTHIAHTEHAHHITTILNQYARTARYGHKIRRELNARGVWQLIH